MIAQAKPSMNTHALIYGLLCWLIALPAWSSYAIYVGKNLTADGSVMIGGTALQGENKQYQRQSMHQGYRHLCAGHEPGSLRRE